MTNIIVFGDSIAQGFWDKKGGWVQRLQEEMMKKTLTDKKDYFVFNCSVSGDTAEDILKRFDTESKARKSDDNDNIIIFSIGSNDSVYVIKKKQTACTERLFSKNIELLIKQAKKYSRKVVFTGLFPVDEKRVDPIPWATDKSYRNEYVQKFDHIVSDVCKKNKIRFINLYDMVSEMNYNKLLWDGVHPNSAGHKIIYKTVSDFLKKEKLI